MTNLPDAMAKGVANSSSNCNNSNSDQLTSSRALKLIKSAQTTTVSQFSEKQQKIYNATHFNSEPPRSLLTLLHCSFMIILTLSSSTFITLANCDKLLSAAAAPPLPPSPPTHALPGVSISRFARNAILNANAYRPAAADYPPNKNKPQRFYTKAARFGGVGVASDGSDMTSLNLVNNDNKRQDICKHCSCEPLKNTFPPVICNFQTNRELTQVFGENFQVPTHARSITIILAPNTHFRLERGFFNNITVNSLTINGTYSNSEQVEITTDAFKGNNGPYPDVQITNVYSVIVRAKAFSESVKFQVRHSNDLILYSNAFENAEINGIFAGINDLRIEEKAFNSAKARLRIESSSIDNIYRFEASLREIRFVNCTIGTINSGTFDVIKIDSIIFENCRIDVIKSRAISEKLQSQHVSITGGIIGHIEGEAIYGSGITELILTKNIIDTIFENAIYVTAIEATISRNNIKRLGHNWLRIKDWSNITIEKNQFGDFGSILLEETKQPIHCSFAGNSLTRPQPGSLNFTHCTFREISVDEPCRCSMDWLNKLSHHALSSETYCTIDEKLKYCFNSSTFSVLKYINEVCDEKKDKLDCVANRNLKKINGNFFTHEELEQRDHNINQLYFIIAGAIALFALVVIAVFFLCFRVCRINQAHTTMTHSNHHHHVFTNADRDVIDQTLRVMQIKYPEIYDPTNDCVQVLLQSDLPHEKCINIIAQIVHLLSTVKDARGDFTGFNGVLTQHFQPPTAPPADPIYSEPGFLGGNSSLDDGFYTSSTIRPIPPEGYERPHLTAAGACANASVGSDAQNGSPEHIYAEPNCAEQPLLRNEYASPADRNMDSMDLYTEPINEREANIPYVAYAATVLKQQQPQPQQRFPQYATPQRNQNVKLPSIPSNFGKPTTAARTQQNNNLPDVLYQSQKNNNQSPHSPAIASTANDIGSKPLTNVRKIAQDLQNMPKFHPNLLQPPSSQRPRNLHLVLPPDYTAPDLSHKQHKLNVSPANTEARLASPEIVEDDDTDADCTMDMRGATALPPDYGSDHSGGSNETVKIDDVIEYVDA